MLEGNTLTDQYESTSEKRARLEELQQVIDENIEGFLKVGAALYEIKKTKIYKETHGTFKEFCRDQWDMSKRNNVEITYSRGRGKNGKLHAYVRPARECLNKCRRISGYDKEDLDEQILKCIKKCYTPIHYYKINGSIIGANNEKNAMAEFRKICRRDDIGQQFEIEEIGHES